MPNLSEIVEALNYQVLENTKGEKFITFFGAIYDVNLNTGAKNIFYEEKQKTWIDLNDPDRITFLKNVCWVAQSSSSMAA